MLIDRDRETGVMNAPRLPRRDCTLCKSVSAPLVILLAFCVLVLVTVVWVAVMSIGMLVLWALGGPDA